jgi:RNA polymerase sigma factor (TIGR02999 family)
MDDSDQITTLLQRWQTGEASAQEELFELVYRELRRIAAGRLRNEARSNSFQTSDLVHEIYPQLARQRQPWQNRSQFYAVASECMRRHLVDRARSRKRQKRGGDAVRVSLSALGPAEICRIERDDEILAVDRAVSKLSELNETAAAVIRHRYFGGMDREEIAGILEVSLATVDRTYRFAKAWLKRELALEFSPYLLSAGQITDEGGFIRQLRADSGNEAAQHWRRILPADVLAELDGAEAARPDLLNRILAGINKSLLAALASQADGEMPDRSAATPVTLITANRRRVEQAFSGHIISLT